MTAFPNQIIVRIQVNSPVKGEIYALQQGKGSEYRVVQATKAKEASLFFDVPLSVKQHKDGLPNFGGPFAQGTPAERFLYINTGSYAKDKAKIDSGRRAKISLMDITWKQLKALDGEAGSGKVLLIEFDGTANDGLPFCATVKPVRGWRVANN